MRDLTISVPENFYAAGTGLIRRKIEADTGSGLKKSLDFLRSLL